MLDSNQQPSAYRALALTIGANEAVLGSEGLEPPTITDKACRE